jgi:hypothetical protein
MSQQTNLAHWRNYCAFYPSPESYITASWLFTIAACLQRRVWINSGKIVFPNQYVWFIADPGVGKDIVKDVRETLGFYDKHGKPVAQTSGTPQYMYPISATSTSREKFMDVLARHPQFVASVQPPYTHASAAFILAELTSIFKHQAQETMTFLLEGWDCSSRYVDDKIGAGERCITNLCVNIIGGTQPDTFSDIRGAKVIGSGFLRRSIMIYESVPRSRMFLIPPHTDDQLRSRMEFLKHTLKLSRLYGPVTLSPETLAYCTEWFSNESKWITNKSPFLKDYYQSKQVHLMKVAMAYHFSESLEMEIQLPSMLAAMEFLKLVERNMHLPFCPIARNDSAEVKQMLLKKLDLEDRPMSLGNLYPPFMLKLSMEEFVTVVNDLKAAGAITIDKEGRVSKFRILPENKA